ncbi:hypothetical protein EW146_g1012 [Bondarzewia mesenterica]|uniref:Uracil-DNA glycosylase-like domain-containing protein n=1 Tax=Bondarzewia mesenterica TaxID=1095465 RepID=A0A4S4M6J4_9AGAM|nr:hypothetical protein EW146_g1012 [Bondarzewia mesenterica]
MSLADDIVKFEDTEVFEDSLDTNLIRTRLRSTLSQFKFTPPSSKSPLPLRRSLRIRNTFKIKLEDDHTLRSPPDSSNTRKRSASQIRGQEMSNGGSGRKGGRKVKKKESNASPTKKQKRGYAPPETYAHLQALDDHLKMDLDIIFCGINPGYKSAEQGHHFFNPTNHFWRCLHQSGLVPIFVSPTEDFTLPEKYNYGLTNLVSRPSSEAAEISPAEMIASAPTLLAKIASLRPRFVCFIGMVIWKVAERAIKTSLKPVETKLLQDEKVTSMVDGKIGAENASSSSTPSPKKKVPSSVGLQPYKLVYNSESSTKPNVNLETLFFVSPSTSGRVVQFQLPDKIKLFAELKALIDTQKLGHYESFDSVNRGNGKHDLNAMRGPVDNIDASKPWTRRLDMPASATHLQDIYFNDPEHLVAFSKILAGYYLPSGRSSYRKPSPVHAPPRKSKGNQGVLAAYDDNAMGIASRSRHEVPHSMHDLHHIDSIPGDGMFEICDAASASTSCAVFCGVGILLLLDAAGGDKTVQRVASKRTSVGLWPSPLISDLGAPSCTKFPCNSCSLVSSRTSRTMAFCVSGALDVQTHCFGIDLWSLGAMAYEMIYDCELSEGSRFYQEMCLTHRQRSVTFRSHEAMDVHTQTFIYQTLMQDLIDSIMLEEVRWEHKLLHFLDLGNLGCWRDLVSWIPSLKTYRSVPENVGNSRLSLASTDSCQDDSISVYHSDVSDKTSMDGSTQSSMAGQSSSDIPAALNTFESFVSIILDETAVTPRNPAKKSLISRSMARLSQVFFCHP